MAINKVVYDGNTLIDLTSDTITVSDVVSGVTFHLRDGSVASGTITDGNEIGYGITDGSIPIVGIAKAGYAHAWDSEYPMMKLGNGQIGIDRVV